MSSFVFLKKLTEPRIWHRLFTERLSEPLHMNFLSLFVALFGTYRAKVGFDLVLRQQHAYALLNIADLAKELGHRRVSVFEFGVAAGAGLLNIQAIAQRVERITGVGFDICGFDTGAGMPPPLSYKDHPELYQAGDFPMDQSALRQRLGPATQLVIGPIAQSIEDVLGRDFAAAPIGFVSIDVDYYSSTVDALRLLEHRADCLLPRVILYLDDLEYLTHNSWAGELLAANEFTAAHPMRPIERHVFLRGLRLFKNARWIDHIFQCQVLDHPARNDLSVRRERAVITNPYL
jgi:hypothetical protein